MTESRHNPRWPSASTDDLPEDRRNVIDVYKYWDDEAIRADLDERRLPYALLCENYGHDFNLAATVRNANAFLASEIHICGRKKWDRRGAVGTYHYEHLHHHERSLPVIEDFRARGFRIVALDYLDEAQDLTEYAWQPESLMIFGQESIGISPEALAAADDVVYIPQLGSVRSLNVGVAAGIAMYSYIAQHASLA